MAVIARGLLIKTLGYAADLLSRAKFPARQRGDVWKLARVKHIARIWKPSPPPLASPGTEK